MTNVTESLSKTVDDFIVSHSSQIKWTYKPLPEKWSAVEILGHLTDSALVNLHRFVRCTYESYFTLTYAQDEWVAAQRYKDADITALLKLWQLLNHQIITVLANYPPHRLQARCNNQTVEFLATDYIDHMRHHLDQIIAFKSNV